MSSLIGRLIPNFQETNREFFYDGSASLPSVTFLSDQDTGIYRSAANTLSVAVGGSQLLSVSSTQLKVPATILPISSTGSLSLTSNVADGATAVAHILDTTNALSTPGAKILSLKNSTTEKAYFALSGGLYIDGSALGTTTASRIDLVNVTAAANGAQQVSPSLYLKGYGWKTVATAASQPVDWQLYVLPVQGASAPTSTLVLQSQINGGGWTDSVTITNLGILTAYRLKATNIMDIASVLEFVPNYSPFGLSVVDTIDEYGGRTLGLQSNKADGATSQALVCGSSVSYTTAGAKLLSFYNSTSEKLYVDKDGLIGGRTTAGITASTTQTQGQGALFTEINEVSVCANANDTVTLPLAQAGIKCILMNNGAQTLRIYPASGDNLGAGVDTATTLAAGSNVQYVAYDATNWEAV